MEEDIEKIYKNIECSNVKISIDSENWIKQGFEILDRFRFLRNIL